MLRSRRSRAASTRPRPRRRSAPASSRKGFASSDNFQSILVGNAYTSLLALGMTFVIISGGIDLSVGSVFALGGVLAAWGTAARRDVRRHRPAARRRAGLRRRTGCADRQDPAGAVHRHAGRPAVRARAAAGDDQRGLDDVPATGGVGVPEPRRRHLAPGADGRRAVRHRRCRCSSAAASARRCSRSAATRTPRC